VQVFLYDEFPPETSAMLQALYSRSAKSVTDHVAKVREKGPDQFMASYYVGYGHASIGDCGVTTFYVEDISLLACKAIQDNPLYSGQETSTRYIDFSNRRVHDPIGTAASEASLKRWVEFYAENTEELTEDMKKRFPLAPAGKQRAWEKAIAARCFDILRGFLPAAVTSQLAWTTNLRQAHEHLLRLESHPLEEVREVGRICRQRVTDKYPNSFGHTVEESDRAYLRRAGELETYVRPSSIPIKPGEFEVDSDVDNEELERAALEIIRDRPRRAQLPKSLGRLGRYRCRFAMDFGSFRDLQRHRGGLCRMPLLTSELGFHGWYPAQLPSALRARATTFIEDQLAEIDSLAAHLRPEDRQYFLPIGMNVACELDYDLPEMVYVAELRAGKTVHPTLRWVAHRMADALRTRHPKLALYADMSDDDFSVRRGEQDIVERVA
jgi:thymidylate synthase ThyX